MASKKKTKVMDKWKQKKWFSVVTPIMFDSKPLCELVATEDKHLVNRVVRTSLSDIGVTGSSSIANFTSPLLI
jgi:small subunit ribosomal protein S3Ae